jgi:hypothetical protein
VQGSCQGRFKANVRATYVNVGVRDLSSIFLGLCQGQYHGGFTRSVKAELS